MNWYDPDILYLKYGAQFYHSWGGSPAGELDELIIVPSLYSINRLMLNKKGDYIALDGKFKDREPILVNTIFKNNKATIVIVNYNNQNYGEIREKITNENRHI